MLRNLCALLAVVVVGIGSLCAQSPAPQATPSTDSASGDIDSIWNYAGGWRIDTQDFDTPYSKAGHKLTKLHNDCWRSGLYIACRQEVDGDTKVLIVFTCTRTDHYCTSYQIPTDGGTPNSGTMLVEGNTWTFPWQTVDAGKTTFFRVVNVWSSSSSLDYRQEFSTDKEHWTRMATGHEFKTSTK
jgi:hypothetical protein